MSLTAPVEDLSAAALGALRCGLQAHLRRQRSEPDLRRALRTVCAEAHRRHLRAEQLLILFKQAWSSLPEVEQLPRGIERDELLGRIITVCIEEFYADGHG